MLSLFYLLTRIPLSVKDHLLLTVISHISIFCKIYPPIIHCGFLYYTCPKSFFWEPQFTNIVYFLNKFLGNFVLIKFVYFPLFFVKTRNFVSISICSLCVFGNYFSGFSCNLPELDKYYLEF